MFARRLVLILAMLAFAASLPLALAVPLAFAAEPCPPEHHAMMAGHEHHQPPQPAKQHRHDAAACLCCCMGISIGVPDFARADLVAAPFTTASVVYPETDAALSGRNLRPEPAPPRTNALS